MPTLAFRTAVLAVVVAVTFANPGWTADPPTPIEKLVEQLGSPSFPTRERATKALRERGPEALPALRKAMESKDEEVRKRAESLIPGLEIEEALLPKRVTLSSPTKSVKDELPALAKQTGYDVTLAGPDHRWPPTVVLTDTPFWEAMELLAKPTGTAVAFEPSNKSVQLRPATTRSPFVNVRGPFRLEASWFHEDRDVDLTQAKADSDGWRNHRLTLAVSVLAEPRLTLLKVHPAKVEEAIDADGKSILDPDEPARAGILQRPMRGTFRGEQLHSSDIRLRRASETAKSAKLIRGTIPVHAILIRKPVTVTAKVLDSAGTTIKAGTESLVILRATNNGGGNIMVEMQVPLDRNGQRDWQSRFHLEDDAGNQFQVNGGGSSSNGIRYTISIYYSPPFNKKNVGPPTKLVFEDWVVHDHAIPFEFRDVPLP